jgi:hypothetical protein
MQADAPSARRGGYLNSYRSAGLAREAKRSLSQARWSGNRVAAAHPRSPRRNFEMTGYSIALHNGAWTRIRIAVNPLSGNS